jgi:hypothetical protein
MEANMTRTLILAATAFTISGAAASAQTVYVAPGYGYAAPAYVAPTYVAPTYVAPAYVAPAPVYVAPPAPVYDYAPGYVSTYTTWGW